MNELLEALKRIAEILNPEKEDNFRSDDPEGAMDCAYATAQNAIDKTSKTP